MKKRTLTLLLILAITGCNPLETAPEEMVVSLPQAWRQPEGLTNVDATPLPPTAYRREWWKDFGDEKLNQLVMLALERNSDLAVAALNLRRAQLQLDLASEAELPVLSASGTAARAYDLKQHDSAPSSPSFGTAASISYEADIWGKLADAKNAAAFEANATAEDLESTRQTLIHSVTTLYWQIALNAEKIRTGVESLAYTQRSYDIAAANHDAGFTSGLDVAEAEQSLAAQKAALEGLQQESVELKNTMAVLLAMPPGSTIGIATELPTSDLPAVAAGLPADIISQRPDIRAARLRLQESLLGVDISKAQILPGVTLTGSYGTSSLLLASILRNPVGVLGASLSLPFLQWTQMTLNIKVAKVAYETAIVNFRQTIYKSLGEVDTALSARQQLEHQQVLLQESLAQSIKAEKIDEARYQAGADPIKISLDAQERTRQSHIALQDNYYARLLNHAVLCMALGGSAAEEPVPVPPAPALAP